jgi:TolB protein
MKFQRKIITVLILSSLVLSGCLNSGKTPEERDIVIEYNDFTKTITNEQRDLIKIQNEWINYIEISEEDDDITKEEKIKLSGIRDKYVAECDQIMSHLQQFTEFLQENEEQLNELNINTSNNKNTFENIKSTVKTNVGVMGSIIGDYQEYHFEEIRDISNIIQDVKQLTIGPWIEKSFSWDQFAISWSPDNSKIAFISLEDTFLENQTSGKVNNNLVLGVMNADGSGKIKVDDFSAFGDRDYGFILGYDFDWNPNNRMVVYTKYGKPITNRDEESIDFSSIWAMDLKTNEKVELALRAGQPSFNPDGTKIVYIHKSESENGNLDVWIMNTDGSDKRKLVSNQGYDAYLPSWSPDGKRILYMNMDKSENIWENMSLWILNADGTNNFELASNARFPKWSPDGTIIAYTTIDEKSDRPEAWKGSVWIINPDGTGKKRLLIRVIPDLFMFAKWSPDGTKINLFRENKAVVLNTEENGDFWTFPINDVYLLSWSLDGKKIIYTSEGGSIIYIINSDGTHEDILLSNPEIQIDGRGLLWSSDGTKITYSAGKTANPEWNTNMSIWIMTYNNLESTGSKE